MFELLKSLLFALAMVPVVMVGLAALIWGLGEVFNLISKDHHRDHKSSSKSA